MSLFFGLLPGWWFGEEPERQYCPLLDEAGWHQILQATGFSGMDVKLPDHNDTSLRSFTVFVSTATELQPDSAHEDLPNVIIIASENSITQNNLARGVKGILALDEPNVSILSPKEAAAINLHHCQCISLLETDTSFFENIGDEDWAWFKNVLNDAQGILWVTCGGTLSHSAPSRALVKGLGRAIRSENVDAHFIELALQATTTEERAVSHMVRVYRQSLHRHEGQRESEFIEHNGHLCIGRVAEATSLNWQLHQAMGHRQPKIQAYGSRQNRVLKLKIGTPGLLETLCFDDELNESPLGPEDVEIEVKAVGGSLQDALVVTGQASSSVLGHECSGIVTRAGPQSGYQTGDRVAACTRFGAYKSLVRTDASAVMRIPESMSLIAAATILSTFAAAYYSLVMLANIQQGESVLIHSGATDVGQAAIQVAQRHGARVFTTMGLGEPRKFLRDTYQIPDENILTDHESDLAIKILAMTGEGVDVVFSSQRSESRKASWDCLAPLGKLLELAANHTSSSTEGVPTRSLAKGISLHPICLDVIMGRSKPLMRKIMNGVAQLFTGDSATLAPQPVHLYTLAQTESAFRYMLEEKSYGKVVVEMRPEDEVRVLPSSLPSYYFEDQATYVIVGGLGGLGQQMVRWMVQRRARHFLLLSRSGPEGDEGAQDLLGEMAAKGVRILAPRCDVTDEECVAATIEKCAMTMPPIKGCIQGAMVLRVSHSFVPTSCASY
jgi:NADPH:quinone reductase-like Zn-dependent oxidoreductase